MSQLHISDIQIRYQGQDLSQFGLFPLIAWFLIDVLKLPDYFGFNIYSYGMSDNPSSDEGRQRAPAEFLCRVFEC